MLPIREDLSTELAVTARVLAHAGALAPDGRITVLAGEVLYLAGRGVSNARMTPYDVVPVWIPDGYVFQGTPPDDLETYLAAHRADAAVRSVARCADGALVTARSLRESALAALRRVRPGAEWGDAEEEASSAGALVGAYPEEREP